MVPCAWPEKTVLLMEPPLKFSYRSHNPLAKEGRMPLKNFPPYLIKMGNSLTPDLALQKLHSHFNSYSEISTSN